MPTTYSRISSTGTLFIQGGYEGAGSVETTYFIGSTSAPSGDWYGTNITWVNFGGNVYELGLLNISPSILNGADWSNLGQAFLDGIIKPGFLIKLRWAIAGYPDNNRPLHILGKYLGGAHLASGGSLIVPIDASYGDMMTISMGTPSNWYATYLISVTPDSNYQFDEVTYNTIKINTQGVYASEFDEVSLNTSTSFSGYYYDIQPADRNRLTLRSSAEYTTSSLVTWSSLPVWNNGVSIGEEITVELSSGDTYFLGNITGYEGTSTVLISNPLNHSIGFSYLNEPPIFGRLYTGVEQSPTKQVAERKKSNGVYQVTGYFDEVSGIS